MAVSVTQNLQNTERDRPSNRSNRPAAAVTQSIPRGGTDVRTTNSAFRGLYWSVGNAVLYSTCGDLYNRAFQIPPYSTVQNLAHVFGLSHATPAIGFK